MFTRDTSDRRALRLALNSSFMEAVNHWPCHPQNALSHLKRKTYASWEQVKYCGWSFPPPLNVKYEPRPALWQDNPEGSCGPSLWRWERLPGLLRVWFCCWRIEYEVQLQASLFDWQLLVKWRAFEFDVIDYVVGMAWWKQLKAN